MKKTDCIIVGGGLVGGLLAITLAKRGRRVRVFEKRGDIRTSGEAGRSINLVLTSRGLDALERVGLRSRAVELTVPVYGRMMHSVDGDLKYQPYGRERECNYSISRNALNGFLITESERLGVEWEFRHGLIALEERVASFDGPEGEMAWEGEWIFGCDGAGSRVRHCLQAQGRLSSRTEWLSHSYMELEIPATAEGGYAMEKTALHIWPRGDHMLMALPNQDGSFTVTLYLQDDRFERLRQPGEARLYFEKFYPDALDRIARLEAQVRNHPVGKLGTVRTEPWNCGARVLLLGDASHAIVPFFGQGMNCGFEDVAVLDAEWDELQTGEKAVADYAQRRRRDSQSIADMALENFVEMRDRVGDERFLRRKRWERELETHFPDHYRSRYGMVAYTSIPYHVVQQVGRYQDEWLDDLVARTPENEDVPLETLRHWVHGELKERYRQWAITPEGSDRETSQ